MKASYEMMCMQLANMNKEEINTQLKLLNCPIDYDKIAEELKDTYNELSVSDHILMLLRFVMKIHHMKQILLMKL